MFEKVPIKNWIAKPPFSRYVSQNDCWSAKQTSDQYCDTSVKKCESVEGSLLGVPCLDWIKRLIASRKRVVGREIGELAHQRDEIHRETYVTQFGWL
jgi:hypothetical protein